MKKTVLLFTMLLCLAGMKGQNLIPNGDFELWSFGRPVGWTTGLYGEFTYYTMNFPVQVNFGSQTQDSHSDNYAIKLQSSELTVPMLGYTIPIPGILQIGESEGFSIPLEDIAEIIEAIQDTTGEGPGIDPSDLSSLTTLVKILAPGIPCSSTPTAVTLWTKYQHSDEDELMVFAMTKKNGVPVDYASNTFSIENPDEYEQLRLDFENPGTESDSIMIVIVSSTTMNGTSVLYVDDVKLLYSGVDVPVVEMNRESIYPNPASDVLYIQTNNDQPYQWTLRDLTGRTLDSGKAVGKTSLNVKKYPAGVYMMTFNVNGSEKTRKVVIR